ncbi:MAG: DMT family transporter [Desulfovibrionaceae bacterium]
MTKSATSAALRADALLLLTAAIWGLAFVFQRTGMEHIGPLTFNGIRFLLGAAALAPLTARTRRHFRPAPGQPAPSAATYIKGGLLAGLVLFGGASLQQAGLVYTTAGKAGFITGLYVVITPMLGLFLRQRPPAATWLGAGLAAAGLYLLSVTGDFSIAFGDLLVLVGAFFWAGHMLVIGQLSPRMDPVSLAACQFVCCGVVSLVAGVATEPVTWAGVLGAGQAILYCGLMSVGVAYTLQVVAQREANPAHAAIILSLESVFAALAGWVLLGEVMDARALVGCALMLGGMLVSELAPALRRAPVPPIVPSSREA